MTGFYTRNICVGHTSTGTHSCLRTFCEQKMQQSYKHRVITAFLQEKLKIKTQRYHSGSPKII